MANRTLICLIVLAIICCGALHGVAFVTGLLVGGLCGALIAMGIYEAAHQDKHRA